MHLATSPRPTIAMVWTRKLDGEKMAGRLRIAHSIRDSLGEWADIISLRLPTMVTDRSVLRFLEFIWALFSSLFSGPLLPVQCALFASPSDHKRLLAQIPQTVTSVYLDGVRSYSFLVSLRRARPDLHIVVDLDDLMSRRMALLLASGEPLSPGYLTKHLPDLFKRLVMSDALGKLLVWYESATLKGIERRVAQLADEVVLLSSEDMRSLRDLCPHRTRATLEAIPAGVKPVRPPIALSRPVRFIFIGTDQLTQNRLTIDYLVKLWSEAGIETPLFLIGLQTRKLALPPSVHLLGYVDSIDDIYDGHSVLLTPSLIGGGLKTKVLEAFAFGAPVIGNALTFESMPVDDYPLLIEDDQVLIDVLRNPRDHLAQFDEAAIAGADYLERCHSPTVFAEHWRQVMTPYGREPGDHGGGRARRAGARRFKPGDGPHRTPPLAAIVGLARD